MTASKSCSIKLLNKSYEIKCPDTEVENLQQAADLLNKQLVQNKKKFKQLDDFHLLLLASLNVSHDLVSSQKMHEQQRQQMSRFISSLEDKIHQLVQGSLEQDLQSD